jgi:hypothetical protein
MTGYTMAMNCPQCGRPLATGARTCVYCAQGNTYKRKEQLAVPKGTTEHRKSLHLGRWILLALVVAGVLACLTPSIRVHLQPLFDKVKSMF